jgi:glycosyltransferase involved in cell wall biosynthesis
LEVRDLWPESAVATGVLNNKVLLNILYWLEYKLYKLSKKIVVLTPAFKDNIETRFPEFIGKIEIITNGADFSLMNSDTQRKKIREQYKWNDKQVFAYFGAHGLANDLMQVIEVAKEMQNDTNVLFVLIGDGMQKKSLQKKAKEYKLNNLQFIDSVPKNEVVNYINAADICMAILKKTDTFKTVYPNKVFDYMSCNKPILVTIDGITRTLIENAGCGLYAEPENLQAFINSVKVFSKMNKEELLHLGKNGFEYVKNNFDREKLAEYYIKIIKDVIDD